MANSILPEAARDAGVARAAADPDLLTRVAVAGASVTQGFRSGLPLAIAFEHAVVAKHEPVRNVTKGLQFMDPIVFGEAQIDRCLEHPPTLFIGVDFLFWYAHRTPSQGNGELARRMQKLELGLEQLDRLPCPIVVGDIPDMHGASAAMLAPLIIPTEPVRAELNRRIHAWAAAKEEVLVVPLSEWVEALKAGDWTLPPSRDGRLPERRLTPDDALHEDQLHLRPIGSLALAKQVIELMRERFGVTEAQISLDVQTAAARLAASRATGAPRDGR